MVYGLAGGGWCGATAELDEMVQQAAEILASAYGRDVEIRFNSGRESGGAWLRTPDKRNDDVGICASLVTAQRRESWERAARRYEDEAAGVGDLTTVQRSAARELAGYERLALAENPEGQLTVYAHIRAAAVPDPALRAELAQVDGWNPMEHTQGRRSYHHGVADSTDEALRRCVRFVPPGAAR